MVTAANQRTGRDRLEADLVGGLLEGLEFLGMPVADHRQVIYGRPKVLADREDLDPVLPQDAEGLDHLVELLAEAFAHRSDVEFNIAGANQMTATEWRELESRMSKVPNLRYLGHISNDAVNALLTRSHVLVNTSRYEGFPNTFIQAWLRKVPVISLSVNPDQLLDTADFGWCANGSLDALYAALRRAIDDPALRETVGARAQCAADALFSVKNIDSLIELLYAE